MSDREINERQAQHRADDRCVWVTQFVQRAEAGVTLGGWNAGQQSAGSLRIEQQRITRVAGSLARIIQRAAQAKVLGLQR